MTTEVKRIERNIAEIVADCERYGYKVDVERRTSDYGTDFATIVIERETGGLSWVKMWLGFRTSGRGKFLGGSVGAILASSRAELKTYDDAYFAIRLHAPNRFPEETS